MKERNKQKILVQISLIVLSYFFITVVADAISDAISTRDVYFAAKNEMISRDLDSMWERLTAVKYFDWFSDFVGEHIDELKEEPGEEVENSLATGTDLYDIGDYFDDDFTMPGDAEPGAYLYIAREIIGILNMTMKFGGSSHRFWSVCVK